MFKKTTVSLLAIGAFLIAGGGIANAVDEEYAGESRVTVAPTTIAQGQQSVVTFSEGWFEPGEVVEITVSGESAASSSVALIAPLAVSTGSTSKAAASDGSLVATFTAPADGVGAYDLDFAGTRDYSTVITVTAADAAPAAAPTSDLAATGGTVSAVVLWTGIGAILAGIVALVAGIIRRRRA